MILASNSSALQERWLWLGGSVALFILAAWVRYFLSPATGEPKEWQQRWQRWPGRPWIRELGRLFYYLGVPAAALLWRGTLTERGLGLQSFSATKLNWTDWMLDIGWTSSIALLAALTVFLSRQQIRKLRASTLPTKPRDLGVAIREALYQESHWAFYRAPFVLLWGIESGSWAGLLPLLLENLLHPLRWDELTDPEQRYNLWLNMVLFTVSTLSYLQTQNIWPILLADLALRWLWSYKSPALE